MEESKNKKTVELPRIEEWESLSGWCRRLAQIYGMDSTKTDVLTEVSRESYIRGVNDALAAKND